MKRLVLVVICLFLISTAVGCWNKREVETLGFVTLLGFDLLETGEFEVTVHILKPSTLQFGNEGGASSEKPFWILSIRDVTIFGAVREALERSPRRLYFAHNRIVIFGERLAQIGLEKVLDVLDRDFEPRRTASVLVAKGLTAREVMEAEFMSERVPSEGIMALLISNKTATSSVVNTSLNELLIALEEEGIDPIVGSISVVREGGEQQSEGDVLRKSVAISPLLRGAAVFKNDKLVGWLDAQETRGFFWVTGEVVGGLADVRHPGVENVFLGIEIAGVDSDMKVDIKHGRPEITVHVSVEASLVEAQVYINVLLNSEVLQVIEDLLSEVIRNEIAMVLEKAQKEYNSDIFGFGMLIWRKYPKEWKDYYKNMWNEIFPNLDVAVHVRSTLLRGGLSTRSIKINRTGE